MLRPINPVFVEPSVRVNCEHLSDTELEITHQKGSLSLGYVPSACYALDVPLMPYSV